MNENLTNTPMPTGNIPTGVPPIPTPEAAPVVTETNFLSGTETTQKDALYADLFQRNENGEFVKKQETKKSMLELASTILSFVMPILLIGSILGAAYVYIRGQEDNSMAENFPFLCGILTSGIETEDPAYDCQTAMFIQADQEKKHTALEKTIVEQLSIYIPIKLLSATLDARDEVKKAREIFENKISVAEILAQFEKVKKSAQSSGLQNIVCNQVTLTNATTLAVQCDVYGGNIGDNDVRSLGSSRIEAIRFIERLSATESSGFIVDTPPTTLSVEDVSKDEKLQGFFKTKTSVTLSMKYLSLRSGI